MFGIKKGTFFLVGMAFVLLLGCPCAWAARRHGEAGFGLAGAFLSPGILSDLRVDTPSLLAFNIQFSGSLIEIAPGWWATFGGHGTGFVARPVSNGYMILVHGGFTKFVGSRQSEGLGPYLKVGLGIPFSVINVTPAGSFSTVSLGMAGGLLGIGYNLAISEKVGIGAYLDSVGNALLNLSPRVDIAGAVSAGLSVVFFYH